MPRPATAAPSSLNVAEDLFCGFGRCTVPAHPEGVTSTMDCTELWFTLLGCLTRRRQGKSSSMAADLLCSVALFLQSGIPQRSAIPYRELNKDLLLGQKFCLGGLAGLSLHEKKTRKAQRMTTRT